jgi:phage terminase large subunit-like protein
MEWSTALPDWRERIVAREPLIGFAPLFPEEAAVALEVFKRLRVVDVAGSPTFGEICEQWVFDFVAAVFGAYDAGQAKRLIREFFLLVSKKNSKSTIAAGIMVTALIRNWRHSAELLIVAPTLEVANNSYKPAADMVRADPTLTDLLHIQDNFRRITHRVTRATLQVVAADTDVVSGKKAAFVLIDELWIFGARPRAESMLREALGGLVSRPEGFVIYLSTQSDDPPAGVFKARVDYFRDVRDGRVKDPKSLPVLYEFPPDMLEAEAFYEPANFYVTNPNLGRSVSREWLEDEMTKARNASPDARAVFLAKHLNVEIGMALRANRWPGAEYWAQGEDAAITFDALLERCEVATVGIDGGGLDDLFGLAVLGRDRATKDWLVWAHAWVHDGVLRRYQNVAPLLSDFAAAGELTIVGDELADISAILEVVATIRDKGLLGAVAVDPAGLGELVDGLATIDVTQEAGNLKGVPQGFQMMNAIKTCERKLAGGTLRHAPSKLMSWCVGNLKIEPTATAIRATRQGAGQNKIDPVMAMFDAAMAMTANPQSAPEYQMIIL